MIVGIIAGAIAFYLIASSVISSSVDREWRKFNE